MYPLPCTYQPLIERKNEYGLTLKNGNTYPALLVEKVENPQLALDQVNTRLDQVHILPV